MADGPEGAPAGHAPGSRLYRRVVAALFAAGVATFALLYSTQALLPELSRVFGVSTADSTWALSLTTLGLGTALLVAGPVSDTVGRTPLLHLSLTASALVALGCALAPSWSALLVLRLLEGVALAGLPAVATAYLSEELPASAHARASGLYIGGTALGGMAGRLLTGAVADVAGWRWALGSAALLGAVCAVLVGVLLPPSQRFTAAPPGVRSRLRTARRAVSDPGLLALYGVGAFSSGALVAVFNALGFRLTSPPFLLGLGAASSIYLVYVLGTVSSTGFGRLADRRGRRAVLPLGCALTGVGLALTVPSSLPVVVVGVGLLTAGFFAVHGVASGWVPARALACGVTAGQAASLYLFAYYLGSTVFGSLAGLAWTASGWPGVTTLAASLVAVVTGLALWLRHIPSLLPGSRP